MSPYKKRFNNKRIYSEELAKYNILKSLPMAGMSVLLKGNNIIVDVNSFLLLIPFSL